MGRHVIWIFAYERLTHSLCPIQLALLAQLFRLLQSEKAVLQRVEVARRCCRGSLSRRPGRSETSTNQDLTSPLQLGSITASSDRRPVPITPRTTSARREDK